jgi:hypothetical protein
MLDEDIHRARKKIIVKQSIRSEAEALEVFHSILQEYWGVPSETILKKFKSEVR